MPTFKIHTVNHDFSISNEVELLTTDEAKSQALKGALEIGADEVSSGTAFFAAEITVENEGKVVHRLMVAVGTSPLQIEAGSSSAEPPKKAA